MWSSRSNDPEVRMANRDACIGPLGGSFRWVSTQTFRILKNSYAILWKKSIPPFEKQFLACSWTFGRTECLTTEHYQITRIAHHELDVAWLKPSGDFGFSWANGLSPQERNVPPENSAQILLNWTLRLPGQATWASAYFGLLMLINQQAALWWLIQIWKREIGLWSHKEGKEEYD